jgi:site-specific recombinase XerC
LLTAPAGLRPSELAGLALKAVDLDARAPARAIGQRRKVRCAPLTKQTVAALQASLLSPAQGDEEVRINLQEEASETPIGRRRRTRTASFGSAEEAQIRLDGHRGRGASSAPA